LFVLKNKHKLRCIKGKLDNHLESTVIIGFTNFSIYILVTCIFCFALIADNKQPNNTLYNKKDCHGQVGMLLATPWPFYAQLHHTGDHTWA
ncbi:MAG: hypothetical protein ACJA13_001576, partial [Paraglaciecola sp.]